MNADSIHSVVIIGVTSAHHTNTVITTNGSNDINKIKFFMCL